MVLRSALTRRGYLVISASRVGATLRCGGLFCGDWVQGGALGSGASVKLLAVA
jgi:hypothetical protein